MDEQKRRAEVLPEPLATKVLQRASELEAARRAGASIEDLRAAALEAGISESAFDEALGEVQTEADIARPEVHFSRRRRVRMWAGAAALTLILAGILVTRMLVPVPAPATTVQETFRLRCIPAHEAASMLRPILVRSGEISFSMREPTHLTISGTPEQLEQARSILEQQDIPGSSSCRAF